MKVFNSCIELVTFFLPLVIIIHNYARVSYRLVKSLKQNAKLMEGTHQERVLLTLYIPYSNLIFTQKEVSFDDVSAPNSINNFNNITDCILKIVGNINSTSLF